MSVQEPPFAVTFKAENIEIRDYEAQVTAEVAVAGTRDQAARMGFKLLAGYIFGKNTSRIPAALGASSRPNEVIAMTAPVRQAGGPKNWVVTFVMPENMSQATLPEPHDPRVELNSTPPARYAVIRFSGLASETSVAARTAQLSQFIAEHSLVSTGPALLARYDPPWTLWFLRRNEVMIPIASESNLLGS